LVLDASTTMLIPDCPPVLFTGNVQGFADDVLQSALVAPCVYKSQAGVVTAAPDAFVTAQDTAKGFPAAVEYPSIESGETLILCGVKRSLVVKNPWLTTTGGALEIASAKSWTFWVIALLLDVKFVSPP
jgi:hypothetical protein